MVRDPTSKLVTVFFPAIVLSCFFLRIINPTWDPAVVDDIKFLGLNENILMILLGFILLNISLYKRGDMPVISALTYIEKFLYFYLMIIGASVFLPDFDMFTKKENRFYVQSGFAGIMVFPILWLIIKTCIHMGKLDTEPAA